MQTKSKNNASNSSADATAVCSRKPASLMNNNNDNNNTIIDVVGATGSNNNHNNFNENIAKLTKEVTLLKEANKNLEEKIQVNICNHSSTCT